MSKKQFELLDRVPNYSHYNATLRRYRDGYMVLSVFFRYSESLPEGTILRIIQVDDVKANFGEASVGPANLEEASSDLLSASIFTNNMPEKLKGVRLIAIAPDGRHLFQVCFAGVSAQYYDLVRELLGGTEVSSMTDATSSADTPSYGRGDAPSNTGKPAATPWLPSFPVPTASASHGSSWIEDGMQLQPPNTSEW